MISFTLNDLELSDLAALSENSSQAYLSALHLLSVGDGSESGWYHGGVGVEPFTGSEVPLPASVWLHRVLRYHPKEVKKEK